MGLFKSDEQRALEAQQKAQAREEAERAQLEKTFWASEIGKARRAFQDGDRYFEAEVPHSTIKGQLPALMRSYARTTKAQGGTDLLGGICDEGWRLVQSGWVYVVTGEETRERFLSSSHESTAVNGEVVGIHLFERDESARRVPE